MVLLSQACRSDLEMLVGVDADIARVTHGDPDAFHALVLRFRHRLYRYLVRLVHDRSIADDLFQQTWVQVAERIRQFDSARSFEPWLFRIARNLAIDHLRRRRPDSLDDPGDAGEPRAASLESRDDGALEALLTRERATFVSDALAALPVIYRDVLTLRFEADMKLDEIAGVMTSPLSTVKSRLRRALDAMRAEIEARAGGRP